MIKTLKQYWPDIKQAIGSAYTNKELKCATGFVLVCIFIYIVYKLI